MDDAAPPETSRPAAPARVDPRLVDLWLRVALTRSHGAPVTAPLPEALRCLIDAV
jgi:hypothetical protein